MPNVSDQTLTIATWNLDRPNRSTEVKNGRIFAEIEKVDADIWVLTETNSCISPGKNYVSFATSPLFGTAFPRGEKYERGENRVTIWVRRTWKAELRPQYCDSHSSICVAIATSLGDLNVYGTLIGIYGLGGAEFDEGLDVQINDWRRLQGLGHLCIVGDFNIFLEDSTSYSKSARQKVHEVFDQLNVQAPTQNILNNVDHIAFSKSFLSSDVPSPSTWNEGQGGKPPDKKISDHMGVCLTLKRSA